MTKNDVIIFDLDDTLYPEIDYVNSAFHEIAFLLEKNFGVESYFSTMVNYFQAEMNVFDEVMNSLKLPFKKEYLLNVYRFHIPNIKLAEDVFYTLNSLKEHGFKLGIITDGRSITQRNKIRSLKLDEIIADDHIIISEEFGTTKPNFGNFEYFMRKYPKCCFTYIGDNPKKDFLAGNALGWRTVCLKNQGRNIHTQDFSLPKEYLPHITINKLKDVLLLIEDISIKDSFSL